MLHFWFVIVRNEFIIASQHKKASDYNKHILFSHIFRKKQNKIFPSFSLKNWGLQLFIILHSSILKFSFRNKCKKNYF